MVCKLKICNEEFEKLFEIKYIFFLFDISGINVFNIIYDYVILE